MKDLDRKGTYRNVENRIEGKWRKDVKWLKKEKEKEMKEIKARWRVRKDAQH